MVLIVNEIRDQVQARRIELKPVFQDFDKLRTGTFVLLKLENDECSMEIVTQPLPLPIPFPLTHPHHDLQSTLRAFSSVVCCLATTSTLVLAQMASRASM